MYTSQWENDSKPQSPQKACGLSAINPQNIPRVLLFGAALANVAVLLNGAFYSIDSDKPVQTWACRLRGDFFNSCLNGLSVSLVSIFLALLFILKDFIMCAINSLSWSRWLQLTEGAVFFLLSVWWVFTSAFHQSIFRDLVASNTTASAYSVAAAAGNVDLETVSPSIGLEFALLGLSIGCFLSNVMWLFVERCIFKQSNKDY